MRFLWEVLGQQTSSQHVESAILITKLFLRLPLLASKFYNRCGHNEFRVFREIFSYQWESTVAATLQQKTWAMHFDALPFFIPPLRRFFIPSIITVPISTCSTDSGTFDIRRRDNNLDGLHRLEIHL